MKGRILVAIALFFAFIFGGGSFLPEEQVCMSIDFCYKGKVWKWSDEQLQNKITVFTHSAQAQKNNRLGSHTQRAQLVQKLHNLGFSYEESFDYTFYGLRDIVDKVCKNINTEMVNATITFNPAKSPYFYYTEEKTGYHIQKEKLYQSLLQQITDKPRVWLDVQPEIIKPEITKESLVKQSQLKSKFETDYRTSSVNRKNNIQLALKCFNGMVLQPNTQYSFNKTTGRRTAEKGYKEANIIVNNEYTEAFGGGVCQVSTTLYNALLLAGVEIVEVHPHSLTSSYVMNGFDAMVNFGSSDLKWINKTDKPLYIRTYANGDLVGAQVFGDKQKNEVNIRRSSQVVKKIKPPEEEVVLDSDMYEDENKYKTFPKEGCEVKSYVEYWKDGKRLSKKHIRTQTYRAVRGVKIVGTKLRPIIQPEQKDLFDHLYPPNLSDW